MTEQPTEAARVKVARLPGRPNAQEVFDVWEVFRREPIPGRRWRYCVDTFDKQSAIEAATVSLPGSLGLISRFNGDPEAMYFDRDHPEGVPVEWEDVK